MVNATFPTEATDLRALRIEQALSIISSTEDGDLLDPSDLGLTQAVVNGQELTDKGWEYWTRLYEATKDGSYVKRHFCGIPGLTRDSEGYVYWRGAKVEHYSYPQERTQQMISSARVLAAICTTLDQRGTKVSWSAISAVYEEIDLGEGLEIPRFLACWSISPGAPRVKITPLASMTCSEIKSERGALKAAAMLALDCDHHEIRNMLVVTSEDLAAVRESLQNDIQWLTRARFTPSRETAEFRELFEAEIARAITQPLKPLQEMRTAVLGEHLAAVTQASEKNLSDPDLQMGRYERSRG